MSGKIEIKELNEKYRITDGSGTLQALTIEDIAIIHHMTRRILSEKRMI